MPAETNFAYFRPTSQPATTEPATDGLRSDGLTVLPIIQALARLANVIRNLEASGPRLLAVRELAANFVNSAEQSLYEAVSQDRNANRKI